MINLTKLVALNTDPNSTQILTFEQNSINYSLLINCQDDDSFVLSKNAVLDIQDKIGSFPDDPKETVESIYQIVFKRLRSAPAFSILVLAIRDDCVYLISKGSQVKCYLYRGKLVSEVPLTESVILGRLKGQDRLILTTSSLPKYLGKSTILLFKTPLENLLATITPILPKEGISVGVVVIEAVTDVFEKDQSKDQPVKRKINKKFPILLLVLILIGALTWFFSSKIKSPQSPPSTQTSPTSEAQVSDPSSLATNYQLQSADISLWLDLDLIKKGFQSNRLSTSVKNLLVLDPGSETLVSIDLTNKSHQVLAGESKLGDSKSASIYSNLAFTYSATKGLLRTDLEDNSTLEVTKKDPEWGSIADIYAFAGNVYLLDQNNQIWKYLPVANGYSDKREYLVTKDVSLSDATKMQIDSSVWVLKGGSELVKFTQGVKDHFSIGGLETPIESIKSFFVSSATDNLYILEKNRLIVLDKTGKALSVYQSDKFNSIDDLVVDEEGKKVYLLEKSKIYVFDLK